MPNHITNEITIMDGSIELVNAIINKEKKLDFSILLPPPINIWHGNVGKIHTEIFKDSKLDWCTKNWGTKWNAYDFVKFKPQRDKIYLVFDTAWSPPYGWLVAVFNKFRVNINYLYKDEGSLSAYKGKFEILKNNEIEWKEEKATEEETRYIMELS